MNSIKMMIFNMLAFGAFSGLAEAQTQTLSGLPLEPIPSVMIAKRSTLAITYPEERSTSVDMRGTALSSQSSGKAEVKRENGRSRIKLEMSNLVYPQHLGSFYTSYVLWAIAPEGQAERLAQLPIASKFKVDATTSFQSFGLIITAEPHGMVSLPSPVIVAENALRANTRGNVTSSQIDYRGDTGTLYLVSNPDTAPAGADYNTPLMVLGARRSVQIARHAGAATSAPAELRQAEAKLAALEELWRRDRKAEREYNGLAMDAMRLGEQARLRAVERAEQARIESERRKASEAIASAEAEAERARKTAGELRESLARAESETAAARLRVDQARDEAERAKANEELARLEAERARLRAEQAQSERDQAQQQLFSSLTAILETRREARGLIVSLSDVLFDFDKATLRSGARERLSKMAGILTSYPGDYRLEIEGHTDAVGSEDYNLKLSRERAEAVREYLAQNGIPASRIIAARGMGKAHPVADNSTDEGRQRNRRVEIIVADADQMPTAGNRQ